VSESTAVLHARLGTTSYVVRVRGARPLPACRARRRKRYALSLVMDAGKRGGEGEEIEKKIRGKCGEKRLQSVPPDPGTLRAQLCGAQAVHTTRTSLFQAWVVLAVATAGAESAAREEGGARGRRHCLQCTG
jgi:hypothetical protein